MIGRAWLWGQAFTYLYVPMRARDGAGTISLPEGPKEAVLLRFCGGVKLRPSSSIPSDGQSGTGKPSYL
jgi:hypothetical protein